MAEPSIQVKVRQFLLYLIRTNGNGGFSAQIKSPCRSFQSNLCCWKEGVNLLSQSLSKACVKVLSSTDLFLSRWGDIPLISESKMLPGFGYLSSSRGPSSFICHVTTVAFRFASLQHKHLVRSIAFFNHSCGMKEFVTGSTDTFTSSRRH